MVDLRSQILSARKPVHSQDRSATSAITGKPASIAPEGNSPFGIYDRNKKSRVARPPTKQAHAWADRLLRSVAGRRERAVLAVRDAARKAEQMGLNPTRDEIYVASSIREAWNLKSDQLSKELRQMAENGAIRFSHRQRGRHARFTLQQRAPEEG